MFPRTCGGNLTSILFPRPSSQRYYYCIETTKDYFTCSKLASQYGRAFEHCADLNTSCLSLSVYTYKKKQPLMIDMKEINEINKNLLVLCQQKIEAKAEEAHKKAAADAARSAANAAITSGMLEDLFRKQKFGYAVVSLRTAAFYVVCTAGSLLRDRNLIRLE